MILGLTPVRQFIIDLPKLHDPELHSFQCDYAAPETVYRREQGPDTSKRWMKSTDGKEEAMSGQENQAVIRQFYDLLNRGKLDQIDDMFTPDYVDHNPQAPAPSLEGLKQLL